MVLELRESTYQLVRAAGAQVQTGMKWKVNKEVDLAVSRLKHQEVVGRVQEGYARSGKGNPPLFWWKGVRRTEESYGGDRSGQGKTGSSPCQGGVTEQTVRLVVMGRRL